MSILGALLYVLLLWCGLVVLLFLATFGEYVYDLLLRFFEVRRKDGL